MTALPLPDATPEAILGATPLGRSLPGPDSQLDQTEIGTHVQPVELGADLRSDHWYADAPRTVVAAEIGTLFDPALAILASSLDDTENLRKSVANRIRILTATEADKDGETRGFGLSPSDPPVAALTAQLATLETVEHGIELAMKRQLRTHPLHPWVKQQKGIGEKTIARLLGVVGDPYINMTTGEIRTVGQLFAYCGVAGPGQRKRKGSTVTWNPTARMRLWVMTDPIIRGDGPYRAIYEEGRERYADKLHTEECVRCGPTGKPAAIGSPWAPAHQHNGARRLVMREILRDLWTEAKRLHELADGRASSDTHATHAVGAQLPDDQEPLGPQMADVVGHKLSDSQPSVAPHFAHAVADSTTSAAKTGTSPMTPPRRGSTSKAAKQ